MKKRFTNLTNEEKIDFFVNCQTILLKYHSNSEFLVRESNLNKVIDIFSAYINQYKGYYYSDNNICILWNHIKIDNPSDPTQELINNSHKDPHPEYNAASMDFVVCRHVADMYRFVKENDEERIKYLLSVKYQKAKILKKEDLKKNLKFF